MIYGFTDTQQSPVIVGGEIQTIFDGVNLDENYEFETFNVSGRGLIAPYVDYTLKTGADGAWFNQANLEPREITVEARITGSTKEDARRVYEDINRVLFRKKAKLRFTDDPNYYFTALFSGVKSPIEDSNELIVDLYFLCLDPWKYGDPLPNGGTIPEQIVYPTVPDQIKVTLTAPASQVKITNPRTGDNIVLKGTYTAGQVITIEFGDRPKVLLGTGQNIMNHLDILSDFELFEVLGGDTLVVTPTGATLQVVTRERLL